MKYKSLKYILLIFIILTSTTQCQNHEEELSCFPRQNIYVTLDLNFAGYFSLNNVTASKVIIADGAGNRGLIVYRGTKTFMAYDRNAPHICPNSKSTLEISKSGLTAICPSDGAQWLLSTGQRVENTKAKNHLKSYFCDYNPITNVLTIYN